LLRIAITGSILAAWEAGIMPDAIPIILAIINPKIMLLVDKMRSKYPILIKLAKYTIKSPAKPPIKHRNTDSNKN
jgi:hypothetical protein